MITAWYRLLIIAMNNARNRLEYRSAMSSYKSSLASQTVVFLLSRGLARLIEICLFYLSTQLGTTAGCN